jgi:hypothetical protein
MTKIHWGVAKEFIANRALLGCLMKMYKPANVENSFVLEIS